MGVVPIKNSSSYETRFRMYEIFRQEFQHEWNKEFNNDRIPEFPNMNSKNSR